MSDAYKYGPFRNDECKENVAAYQNPAPPVPVEHEAYRAEITDYFTRRHARLQIVKTTRTPRGQVIDWIPIESQHPKGVIATPPPRHVAADAGTPEQQEVSAVAELERDKCERGPSGTVPIMRKKLDALGYTVPLKQYLAKYRNPMPDLGGFGILPPGPGRGTHWYGNSNQNVICFGGEGQFSCFDPYTASSDELSLIQIGLSNSDLPSRQTVEAGWQEYYEITGDWVPHLFVYYTTNGYSKDADNQGGYNMDVDGWVQNDDVIFPGSTLLPYSVIGGEQRKISLKYQLFENNWWLSCQGRWVGYYPASLFMGNQSVFSTLGDHADRIGFWGEIASRRSTPTNTDMGSGRFPKEGWTRAAYFHNLRIQSNRGGGMSRYRGADSRTDSSLYDIDEHFDDEGSWESFAFVGGPGAG
jgi:hypothetical protein